MILSSYAWAVGQWLQVNIMTSTPAFLKDDKLYVLPSTPGNLKSGAEDPMASVLWSACALCESAITGNKAGNSRASNPFIKRLFMKSYNFIEGNHYFYITLF